MNFTLSMTLGSFFKESLRHLKILLIFASPKLLTFFYEYFFLSNLEQKDISASLPILLPYLVFSSLIGFIFNVCLALYLGGNVVEKKNTTLDTCCEFLREHWLSLIALSLISGILFCVGTLAYLLPGLLLMLFYSYVPFSFAERPTAPLASHFALSKNMAARRWKSLCLFVLLQFALEAILFAVHHSNLGLIGFFAQLFLGIMGSLFLGVFLSYLWFSSKKAF